MITSPGLGVCEQNTLLKTSRGRTNSPTAPPGSCTGGKPTGICPGLEPTTTGGASSGMKPLNVSPVTNVEPPDRTARMTSLVGEEKSTLPLVPVETVFPTRLVRTTFWPVIGEVTVVSRRRTFDWLTSTLGGRPTPFTESGGSVEKDSISLTVVSIRTRDE